MLIASNGGCTDTVYTTTTVVQSISVEENYLSNQIAVFPNPANNKLNVVIENIVNENISINIYNSLGGLISSPSSNGENSFTINTEEFSSGIYILQLNISGKIISTRITISH